MLRWDFKGKRSAENEQTRGNNTEYLISYTYFIIYHYTCTHVRNLTSPAGHWLFWENLFQITRSVLREMRHTVAVWTVTWATKSLVSMATARHNPNFSWESTVYNNDEKKLMICSRFPNPKLAVGKRFSKWIVSPGPMCSKTIILPTATGKDCSWTLGSKLLSRLGMSRATSQTYHLLWSDLLTLGKTLDSSSNSLGSRMCPGNLWFHENDPAVVCGRYHYVRALPGRYG